MSYHEDRLWLNGQLAGCATVEERLHNSNFCTVATSGLMYHPQMMIGEGDCGAVGGMKIDRGNRSTQRKPAPAPLCPPQIPLDQTRDRTRVTQQ
jgi:hypothetical protein